MNSLDNIFLAFSGGNSEMDNKSLVKFCKDTSIINNKFTSTDVDIIFQKVKTKGQRKINFKEFEYALEEIAQKKQISIDDLLELVFSQNGPNFQGTKADNVKFHDDKSLYTGVYAQGGPKNVDNKLTLQSLANRGEADIRGVQIQKSPMRNNAKHYQEEQKQLSPASSPIKKQLPKIQQLQDKSKINSERRISTQKITALKNTQDLELIYLSYTKGSSDIDGKTFAKLMKDSDLLDSQLTATDIDLIFAKAKTSSAIRKISYQKFEQALELIAIKKGIDYQQVIAIIQNSGGPQFQGTKADNVKFHDDKSLYTGVYANGGPTNYDRKINLSNLADRSEADVRGVKK